MKKNYDFDWNVAADPATDSGDYLHDVVSAEVDESIVNNFIRKASAKVLSDVFNPEVDKCNTASILNAHIQIVSKLVGEPTTRRDALMAFAGFKAALFDNMLDKMLAAGLDKK